MRIGNWIINGIGEEFQVNGHTISSFGLAQKMLGELKPIPLTEEWLKKCGFYSSAKDYGFPSIGHNIVLVNGRVFLRDCEDKIIGIQIQYVHQLQNLYFAISGEELQIA